MLNFGGKYTLSIRFRCKNGWFEDEAFNLGLFSGAKMWVSGRVLLSFWKVAFFRGPHWNIRDFQVAGIEKSFGPPDLWCFFFWPEPKRPCEWKKTGKQASFCGVYKIASSKGCQNLNVPSVLQDGSHIKRDSERGFPTCKFNSSPLEIIGKSSSKHHFSGASC